MSPDDLPRLDEHADLSQTNRNPAEAAHEDGHGRSATRPSDIPARGWMDILWRVYQGISDDRILMNAAGVTFYALLALFPAIAAIVSIYGLFADPAQISQQMNQFEGVVPGGGMSIIRDQLTRIASKGGGSLTAGFLIGLLVSLWSANGGIKGLFDALNVVYGETEKRSFLKLNAISLAVTLGTIAFLVVAMVCVIAIPALLDYFPGFIRAVVNYARWPLILVLVAAVLAVIYRFGPSRDKPQWRWLSWGSVAAALLWLAVSGLFSWYAANFGTFDKTYGSLGAIIGFMLWIWLSTIVILLGGKLNAEIEHQTARDTTVGEPKPLGGRGARMADTVGHSS